MIAGGGVAVSLPEGWEGRIDPGTGTFAPPVDGAAASPSTPTPAPGGATRRTVAHLANFPLPAQRADYGGGAVETMRSGDVFIALVELDPASTGSELFRHDGMPTIRPGDFDPNAVQQRVPGAGGAQQFFTVAGRAFCVYVVVGSHIDRADVLPVVNDVLSSVVVG